MLIAMALTNQHREAALMDSESLGRAAECLKSIAHPIRLRLLGLLLHGEYTVPQ
jgi:hypothetical protein